MCFVKKQHLNHTRGVKVKTWGSRLRRNWGTRTALHTLRCEVKNFSHSSFYFTKSLLLASHETRPICVLLAQVKQSDERGDEGYLMWFCQCGVCLWCRVQIADLNLWAPQELEKALNLQPQSSFLLFKSAFTNTLRCSFHPSIFVFFLFLFCTAISCLEYGALQKWTLNTQHTLAQIQTAVLWVFCHPEEG